MFICMYTYTYMSIFQTAFFHALQHLADFVCPLGMHAYVETPTLPATK